MATFNRLLERQMRRYFGDVESVPQELVPLFERISHSYDHYESDRELIERTLDLSSEESLAACQSLREETRQYEESRERFQTVAEATSDVIYEWYPRENKLVWYGRIDESLGYEMGSFPHTTEAWTQHIHPEDRTRVQSEAAMMSKDCNRFESGYRVITKLGQIRHWSMRATIFREADGTIHKWIGAISDVTSRKDYEIRLKESEERFRLVAESLGEGLIITDHRDTILYTNMRFIEMTGFARHELVGKQAFRRLLSENSWPAMREMMKDRMLGQSDQFEIQLMRKNGEHMWCFINATPFKDAAGQIVGTLAAVTDITSRKVNEEKLRSSEENVLALIENTENTIWSVDRNLRLVTYNSSKAEETLRVVGVHLRPGMQVAEFHKPSFAEQWKTWYMRALRGEHFTAELEHDIGGRCHMEYSFNPILSGNEVQGVSVFGKDITEERILTEQLIHAKEKAEEMSRLKSAFLANMSHEIRTPMTAIMGFTGLLLESTQDEEVLHSASIIHRSANRLLTTINGILDLARIESDTVAIEYSLLPIWPEAERVVELLKPLATQKGIELRIEGEADLHAMTDGQCLSQILTNIIGNAIKFTPEGSVIVRIGSEVRNDVLTGVLEVQDTGIGIAEDFMPQVFEEFKQESSGYARTHEGTGLGLTISRALARRIGGDIVVSSVKGKGSTFKVYLPILGREEETSQGSTAVESQPLALNGEYDPLDGASILIVEDSAETIELLRLFLKKHCQITVCRSADEAYAIACEYDFDAILMDLNLGAGMTGLDVTRKLRVTDRHRRTPILALTAYAMSGDEETALRAGCTAYLTKPFAKPVLLDKIRELLHTSQSPLHQFSEALIGF